MTSGSSGVAACGYAQTAREGFAPQGFLCARASERHGADARAYRDQDLAVGVLLQELAHKGNHLCGNRAAAEVCVQGARSEGYVQGQAATEGAAGSGHCLRVTRA